MAPDEKIDDLATEGFDASVPDGMAGRGSGSGLDGIENPAILPVDAKPTITERDLGTDLGKDPTLQKDA